MPDDYVSLANPLMDGIGNISDRQLPSPGAVPLPSDIEIISADDHWAITEDIFYDNFPAHLKDRAPRIWFDAYWRIGTPGLKQTYGAFGSGKNIQTAFSRSSLQAAWNHDVRTQHLHAENIKKEIVFPQSLLGYYDPDPEIREWINRTYNDYMAAQHRANPNFFGMGLFSNWWDPTKVQTSMDQIVQLGLKGFLMPIRLRNAAGEEISYADPEMDLFWTIAERAELPVCFHVGEGFNYEGPGAMATGFLVNTAPFRKQISQIVFGGVLDRHPNLQIVFAESGISWVLAWLQDAEALYDTYVTIIDPIKHRPSYYWHKNFYATFQADALGLSRLDVLGANRVMWASDYPHTEGTFGFSGKTMQSIIDQAGLENAKLILGGNAKRVFHI